MKYLILSLSCLSSLLSAQPYSGDSWKKASSNKAGRISIAYVNTPSFVYVDDSGKLTGICIEIMNDFTAWIKSNKNVTLTPKYVGDGSNFRKMYDGVKTAKGGVFGLGNITITEERKKEVRFTTPFITNFAILITQRAVPTLGKLEDMPKKFSGLTAYTAKGTLDEKRMLDLKATHFPAMKLEYTTTSQETLEKVSTDPKGFAYLDLAFYMEAVQLKKSIKRHPVADKAAEQFGMIMPMSSDWGPVFEEFMNADGGYLNSSRYKSILIKHMGESGMKLMQSAK